MTATHLRWILSLAWGLLAFPLCGAWMPMGPFGGSASLVVADPHSSRTFVAGTNNALLFRSRDAGESWMPLAFPAQLRAVLETLAIDPQTPGVYLAGLSSNLSEYSGILRSSDAGATWQQIPELRNRQVWAIAFKRANSKIVAAGTDVGVFESQDGGNTWSRISPAENRQLQPIVSVAFDPDDHTMLYAGTPHLPWKTSDGGVSWVSIHDGMIDDSDIFSIQADRNRPQRVIAGACSGIYRSLNGGALWTKLRDVKDASYRTYVVAQDVQYEDTWFAGTSRGILRSHDGGASWAKIGPFATRSIAFDPGRLGRILIATEEAGILRTEDGGNTWEKVNHGFCNRPITSLWIIAGRIYTTISDDLTTARVLSLASSSTDWEAMAAPPPLGSGLTALLSPAWTPNLVLASYENRLLVSEDAGEKWKDMQLPAANMGIRAFEPLDPPWIAAVGTAHIFLSADGKSWRRRALAAETGEVYDITSTRSRRLLAATARGIWASDDLGVSWQPLHCVLEGNTVQAICHHPDRTSLLFAAAQGVVYASGDGGRSWRRISSNDWPISSIKQMIVVPGSPDRLFVLTQQQGVWAWSLDGGSSPEPAAR